MRSLMQNNCAVLITKHQSLKVCQHFPVLSLVIFLWNCQVPASNNSQNVMRQRPPPEKYSKQKNSLTHFCSLVISASSSQISRKSVNSTYPINSFKEKGLSRKTNASFRPQKICEHGTPYQRDMSTQKAASQ